MKKIIKLIPLFTAVFLCLQTAVFAEGDPNVDNGGGELQDGTENNFWNPGEDGVRVSVVDSETGAVKSASIDITNINASNIKLHFGKVCKSSYISGTSLKSSTEPYIYYNPAQAVPTIISDGGFVDIEAIRSYFTDKQVITSIGGYLGFSLNTLTNGDYKLLIEPVMYITYRNKRTAMTATEAALYNLETDGAVINRFAPLSHMNLPFSMFLEEDDLGYRAWTGETNAYAADSDIINYLGIGIVTFKEKEKKEEVEVESGTYEYRVDTDVYTSITVSGGEHTPDNPITVTFTIKNRQYTVGNVVYPEGSSQLVWVKWHTPLTEQTVNIDVSVEGGASVSEADITAKIVDLNENPPPDPNAQGRNDSFSPVSPPSKLQKTTAAWSVWESYWKEKWIWVPYMVWHPTTSGNGYWQDHGDWEDQGEWKFRSKSFSVSMDAEMEISPDEKNPTAKGSVMKSGYGINEVVTGYVTGNGEYTSIQNAVSYFPEFKYKTYWRLLDRMGTNRLEFRKNKYSTYNRRVHFSPLWYPDGEYKVYTWVIDCWTPAGMLSKNCTDSLTIEGSVFDDWHVSPSY